MPEERTRMFMNKRIAAWVIAANLLALTNANAEDKQTVFNDDNYEPKPTINSLPPVEARQRNPQTRRVSPGISGTKYPVYVTWEDARNRQYSWMTHLDYGNSKIDTWSICSNLRKGSIEYRNCRKGGRDWLRNKCVSREELSRLWREMYCTAAEFYRP